MNRISIVLLGLITLSGCVSNMGTKQDADPQLETEMKPKSRVIELQVKQAPQENMKKAAESGNKLTQTLNKDGDLVSVTSMNTQATGEMTTIEDVRKELFEGDNIVTNDKTDRGLSTLTSNSE